MIHLPYIGLVLKPIALAAFGALTLLVGHGPAHARVHADTPDARVGPAKSLDWMGPRPAAATETPAPGRVRGLDRVGPAKSLDWMNPRATGAAPRPGPEPAAGRVRGPERLGPAKSLGWMNPTP